MERKSLLLFSAIIALILAVESRSQSPAPQSGLIASPLPQSPFGTYVLGTNPGALSIGPEGMFVYGVQPGSPPTSVPFGSLEQPGISGFLRSPSPAQVRPEPVPQTIPQSIPIQVTCNCQCPTPQGGEQGTPAETAEPSPTDTQTASPSPRQ